MSKTTPQPEAPYRVEQCKGGYRIVGPNDYKSLPRSGPDADDEAELLNIAHAHGAADAERRCAELVEALRGVVAVADRKTDEFDRARAALAHYKPKEATREE